MKTDPSLYLARWSAQFDQTVEQTVEHGILLKRWSICQLEIRIYLSISVSSQGKCQDDNWDSLAGKISTLLESHLNITDFSINIPRLANSKRNDLTFILSQPQKTEFTLNWTIVIYCKKTLWKKSAQISPRTCQWDLLNFK